MNPSTLIKISILMVLFGTIPEIIKAQDKSKYDIPSAEVDTSKEYVIAHVMPTLKISLDSLQGKITLTDEFKNSGKKADVVVLRALVGVHGKVLKVNVVKSVGYGCDETAVSLIKNVEFIPGTHNGITIKIWVTLPIRFENKFSENKE